MKTTVPIALFSACLLSACLSSDDEGTNGPADSGQIDSVQMETGGIEEDATAGGDVTEEVGPVVVESPSCETVEALELSYPIEGCGYEVTHPRGTRHIFPSCAAAGGDAMPRHLHLTYPAEDASAVIAMNWATGPDTIYAEVRLGTAPDALDDIYLGHSFDFTGLGEQMLHEVHICDLEPSTTYYYQAGGPGGWSEVYTFVTAPELGSDDEFTFAVTGDSRSDTNELWTEALEGASSHGADLLLFTGDAVETGGIQVQWDSWFAAGEGLMSEMPYIPANGNHDLYTVNYLTQFALPRDEDNFAVRYGNALIISLNDFPLHDPQALETTTREFLRETLEANQDVTWTFLINHRAFYSASNHGSTAVLQREWLPLIDEFEVDLVFNGHDHNYERSRPIRRGEVTEMGEGTIFVISAGVGAPMYDNGSEWWTEVSEKVPSYGIVDVDGNELSFTAYRLDGTVIDSFTLTKQ